MLQNKRPTSLVYIATIWLANEKADINTNCLHIDCHKTVNSTQLEINIYHVTSEKWQTITPHHWFNRQTSLFTAILIILNIWISKSYIFQITYQTPAHVIWEVLAKSKVCEYHKRILVLLQYFSEELQTGNINTMSS